MLCFVHGVVKGVKHLVMDAMASCSSAVPVAVVVNPSCQRQTPVIVPMETVTHVLTYGE